MLAATSATVTAVPKSQLKPRRPWTTGSRTGWKAATSGPMTRRPRAESARRSDSGVDPSTPSKHGRRGVVEAGRGVPWLAAPSWWGRAPWGGLLGGVAALGACLPASAPLSPELTSRVERRGKAKLGGLRGPPPLALLVL